MRARDAARDNLPSRKLRILSRCLVLAAVHVLSGQSHGQTAATTPAGQKPEFSVPVSPKLRMPAEVDKAEAAGPAPSLVASIPFRSTLSSEELAARKAAAAAWRAGGTGAFLPREAVSPQAPFPVLKGIDFAGLNQLRSGGWLPPDTHGAVGKRQFVEIVNQRLAVYSNDTPPSLLRCVSLASFFGYTATPLFDPRVIYDATWRRWIVSAAAFHESASVQWIFVAVSKTADATGDFFVYSLPGDLPGNGQVADFPQLGMDQDTIVMTANVFSNEIYDHSEVIAFAKALVYNGLPMVAAFFLIGPSSAIVAPAATIAPPIVLDQNPRTFLVAAPPSGSALSLFTLRDSSRGGDATLAGPVLVPVAAYDVPPSAQQPGTGNTLDTSDSRFVNASTQVQNALWQVHTVNDGGLATPVWYKIDTETPGVFEMGNLKASTTSFDFNASIAANADGDMFVTWSSTDPTGGVNPQVRFSGKMSGDATMKLSGTALFTSPTPYFLERWGDYSSITISPNNKLRAWLVNETTKSTLVWGSRIGRIGF